MTPGYINGYQPVNRNIRFPGGGTSRQKGGMNGFLSQIMGKLKLDDLDTGDLLLLAILFLLFREGEDEELLLALGLLLIL